MDSDVVDHGRRRLLGAAAGAIVIAELGLPTATRARAAARPQSGGALGPTKQVDAGLLNIGYIESGPAGGPVAILLHGWPYDIHSFAEVVPLLVSAGYRVIVPHLRGYGSTRFRANDTVRNGQQSALAMDVVELMDALGIQQAVLAGFDWGARTACIVAALWPERCKALVSVSGYLIGNQEAGKMPLQPTAELSWWYQFYFATNRGRVGYELNRKDFARLIWQTASPQWRFDDATFDRSAIAFDNPDHVNIVIHNYRWRLGLADGERRYDALELRLARAPAIGANDHSRRRRQRRSASRSRILCQAVHRPLRTPTDRRRHRPQPAPGSSARLCQGRDRCGRGLISRAFRWMLCKHVALFSHLWELPASSQPWRRSRSEHRPRLRSLPASTTG
jgi:pimeloyl-ACP methyl ester carboxylesterase